jgi:hypothetical protein
MNTTQPSQVGSPAEILYQHFWTASDDQTCSCGWTAPGWAAMNANWTDDQDEPLMEAAARAFAEHQAEELGR